MWLDAVSVSLLMAGNVEGDLARSIGARPYLIKNKVSDEVQLLINKFGSEPGARRCQGRHRGEHDHR